MVLSGSEDLQSVLEPIPYQIDIPHLV